MFKERPRAVPSLFSILKKSIFAEPEEAGREICLKKNKKKIVKCK